MSSRAGANGGQTLWWAYPELSVKQVDGDVILSTPWLRVTAELSPEALLTFSGLPEDWPASDPRHSSFSLGSLFLENFSHLPIAYALPFAGAADRFSGCEPTLVMGWWAWRKPQRVTQGGSHALSAFTVIRRTCLLDEHQSQAGRQMLETRNSFAISVHTPSVKFITSPNAVMNTFHPQ